MIKRHRLLAVPFLQGRVSMPTKNRPRFRERFYVVFSDYKYCLMDSEA